MNREKELLLADTERQLLVYGGVSDWAWFSAAMENYIPHEDQLEDALAFLAALDEAGVNNWEWYSEALAGFSAYAEYVEEASEEGVLSFEDWRKVKPVVATPPAVPEPVKATPKASEVKLRSMLADLHPDKDADELLQKAVSKGVWQRNVFPKEFETAMRIPRSGSDFLEEARIRFLGLIAGNGKLKKFAATLV